MNQIRFAAALTGATLLAAPLAGAQQQTWVELTGAGSLTSAPLISPANGLYYISPYAGSIAPTQAQLPNGTPVNLNCVDFFHDVTIGQELKANVTSLGTAAASPANATADLSLTRYDNLDIYEQAAWLTTQYAGDGNNATEADAIQTAIWWLTADGGGAPDPTQGSSNIFEGPTPTAPVATVAAADAFSVGTTQYWIDLASYEYDRQASGYYDQFDILTDADANLTTCYTDPVNKTGAYRCDTDPSSAQEFIVRVTPTPEPGTLLLGATGLFSVLGYGAFRRRKGRGLGLGTEVALQRP